MNEKYIRIRNWFGLIGLVKFLDCSPLEIIVYLTFQDQYIKTFLDYSLLWNFKLSQRMFYQSNPGIINYAFLAYIELKHLKINSYFNDNVLSVLSKYTLMY